MAYTLIKGVYHIVGYSPDGDSIKFRANNNARWDKIITDHRETFEEKLAAENGVITLRLQGIDALETHYSPPTLRTPKDLARSNPGALQKPEPGGHKQPSKFGQLATAEFLRLLGVNNVEWRSFGKNTWISNAWIQKRGKEVCVDSKHQDNIPGYIVTDDVEKNGRPIAWVFPGSARERDGSTITADRLADRLEQSANYHLLQKGLVYPYFFMTLPARLRDKLAGAARQAQQTAAQTAEAHRRDLPNLWAFDKTVTGVNITTLSKITDDHELFPYLFRKILKHWYRTNMEKYWDALRSNRTGLKTGNSSRVSLKGFFESGNPYVFVISKQDFVRLDSIIEIKRNNLKMEPYPFDIVFLS